MKRLLRLRLAMTSSLRLAMTCIVFLCGCASTSDKPNPEAKRLRAQEISLFELSSKPFVYKIEQDDALDISVWGHPELSKEVTVSPDGIFSYPFVGDIQASGLTIGELKEKIIKGLSEYAKKTLKTSVSKDEELETEYLIGIGDTLEVSVWKSPDLSRDVIVRPDGMISFPLLGDIKASGLTLTDLDEQITNALIDYVKEPQVSVMVKSFGNKREAPGAGFLDTKPEVSITIKKFGGRKVIILGDVIRPGVYQLSGDTRLAEALALAGDCTKYAVKKNILVIRGDIHRSPTVISSNMLAFLKQGNVNENVLIQPQDVIFVPRSLIGNINTFLESIAPLVDTAYKGLTIEELSGRR